MRTIKQVIPQEQKDIIVNALSILQKMYDTLPAESQSQFMTFDIVTLRSLMKYNISVELTDKEFGSFSINNGVDFPEYR